MIHESREWKEEIEKNAIKIKKNLKNFLNFSKLDKHQKYFERACFEIEKNFLYSAISIRKLFEQNKVTDLIKNKTIELNFYDLIRNESLEKMIIDSLISQGHLREEERESVKKLKTINYLNKDKLDNNYDFNNENRKCLKYSELINRIIHSEIFIIIEDNYSLAGASIFITSDNFFNNIFCIDVFDYINILRDVIDDNVVSSKSYWFNNRDNKFKKIKRIEFKMDNR